MSSAPASAKTNATGPYMESLQQRLSEIRQLIDNDQHRKQVLSLCNQTEPRSFEEYSSSGSFRKLKKFESSTYSEVLTATNSNDNQVVVMKIMRALSKGVIEKLPTEATKGCQAYSDILNEVIITQALNNLHTGVKVDNQLYKTHSFCQIFEIKVVSGNLEKILVQSLKEANAGGLKVANRQIKDQAIKINETSNKEPADDDTEQMLKLLNEEDLMLVEALPSEYVISVMKHDGRPLWWMMTNKKLKASQLVSILVQVIVGLAIAEKVYNYEHRDLHVSNILIRPTSHATLPFILANSQYTIETFGVKATIIDATFSRLSYKHKVYNRDLTATLTSYASKKNGLKKMTLQDKSYRTMVEVTKNNWESFKPKTNLIWLQYLCKTFMKNEAVKENKKLNDEIVKIHDLADKSVTTHDLLKKL